MDKELNPDESVRKEQIGAESSDPDTSESGAADGKGDGAGKTEPSTDADREEESGDAPGSAGGSDTDSEPDSIDDKAEGKSADSQGEERDEPPVDSSKEEESSPEGDGGSDSDIEVSDEGEDELDGDHEPEDEGADDIVESFEAGNEPSASEPGGDADENRAHEEKQEDKAEGRDGNDNSLPPVDYSGFGKPELIETLGLIIENRPVGEIRDDVERIKIHFYKIRKAEIEEEKRLFIESGGKPDDFSPSVDETENRLKQHLDRYKKRRSDFSKVQESQKRENLKRRYEIIEKIKDLVNREESINKTFQEFRSLQNEWHSIGVVPQSALKDMWENYHHSVEVFYNYIKINKELRDLDLKKNLEAKIQLCEKAEELLLEPDPVAAFRTLQDYHNRWREIGPVPHESKAETWERFREATSKINKNHSDFFEKQKEEQKKNLEAKTTLCEKVEEINLEQLDSFKAFEAKSREIIEIQKLWKTIGFAPRKHNNKIYRRFRQACDNFFEKKRAYYAENIEKQAENIQKKTDLCVQAESLMESDDWKNVTETLKRLQREWKEVGPIPRRQSEKLWKRFRKACDTFFERKAAHFSEAGASYDENLKAKNKIIEELENFDENLDVRDAFEKLKEIQRRWSETGFVPFKQKDAVNRKYKEALNKQFDRLQIDDEDKNILKYKSKLENVHSTPTTARRLRTERDKFLNKIKQLESDIILWENNIGFFAKSKTAESMISEVEEKIENARKTIRVLEEKIRMIDKSGLDE